MNNTTVKHIWALSVANMNVICELLETIKDKTNSIIKFEDEYYRFMRATNVLYSENIFKEG